MKVLGISGSARKDGNTARLIEEAFGPLREAGHECDLVQLADRALEGCRACGACGREKDRRCHGRNDFGNEAIEMMEAADAIILGSPVYFADVSSKMKALMERTGYVARANDNMFRRKLGAAVVAVRRAGAIHAFDSLNHFFLIGEMIVVGSSYWNIGIGRKPGEVEADVEGMSTMRALGENLAWLLERMA
ncbi:MAG: flavodoxin family protein [Coriobacteriia bacterium]|nr:flavodoxin family protein [Coriobacteriia bacterium]